MATIGITGLSAGDMTPGVYVDLQLGVGESAGFQGVRNLLLLGQKVSTAPGVDGQVYGPDTTLAVTSEADVIALYGAGSEIHKMYAMVVAINKVTPVYTLSVAPGTSATAATGTITVSTTTITNGGSLVIWVADQAVEVPILTSSTPTSIAADAVLAINAANMMVTASAALGVITITTRNKGLRFNAIKYQAAIMKAVGATVTPTTNTAMANGAVEDSVGYTAALAAIESRQNYYIVSASGVNDGYSVQFTALKNQLAVQAQPVNGRRQRCFCASSDVTWANVKTFSTGVNEARAEIIWQKDSDHYPAEIAAHNAAIYALLEASTSPITNFDGTGGTSLTSGLWRLKAPRSGKSPTRAEAVDAMNSGVSAIETITGNRTRLISRVTSKCLSGTNPDYRTRDASDVTVSDFFCDDLYARTIPASEHKGIGKDPKGSEQLQANLTYPFQLRGVAILLLNDYTARGLLDGEMLETSKAGLRVIADSAAPGRISAVLPLYPVQPLHQIAWRVEQK